MTPFDGKTIAVASKLAQRYASRSNNLPADLRRVGATLLEGFDVDADLFVMLVMASKSKGFAKRVAKTGKPCITEAELEEALQEALRVKDAATPRPPRRKAYNVVHELETCRAPFLSPVARRQSLIEVLCEARGHGVDAVHDLVQWSRQRDHRRLATVRCRHDRGRSARPARSVGR